ncbi:hypothetical protein C9J19_09190 [Photobacterium phosphoreum]|uniref:hypothetical protein n=1 Tax=Photobacterium phosphoreum TaxID=659 RepID=UPI000D175B91|nr:hypothetical protein [Photobacterium phosphoreum]PSW28937.1 hypothetical protein C9J19_09190 [Photobacterium phosphoreum]
MNRVNITLTYSPQRSQDTWSETVAHLEIDEDLLSKYENLTWTYRDVGRMIPMTTENFFSGHFFPYSQSVEEFQVSTNLAFSGFYKQAFISLRGALELGLMSVYYNINDDGHDFIKSWLKAEDSWDANTPSAKRIWNILLSNENIKRFDGKYGLQNLFKDLGFLSNYAHAKGYKYSNFVGKIKSNYQTFELKVFIHWLDTYEKIVRLVTTLHMIKYPISCIRYDWDRKVGFDNPFPVCDIPIVDRLEEIIGYDFFNEIQQIANEDDATQDLMNHIFDMPDLTEQAREDKIIKLDKLMIECGNGFEAWKENEFSFYSSVSSVAKQKMCELELWAKLNGHYEPKF